MLKTRIISSVVGILALGAVIAAGGYWLRILFIVLGFIGLFEFFRMMRSRQMKGMLVPAFMLYFCLVCRTFLERYFMLAVFLVILLFAAQLFIRFSEERLPELAFSLVAPLYLGCGLYFAVEISGWGNYLPAIVLAFLLTWSSDIGGYAVGMRWGRHKMAPSLSPGKTWEGASGCVAFSALASLAFACYTGASYWGMWLALGVAASIAAQMGDLLESAFKRYFGVKDSGELIPGHGGVLDRFDSFLFVLPLVYYVNMIGSGIPGR